MRAAQYVVAAAILFIFICRVCACGIQDDASTIRNQPIHAKTKIIFVVMI